MFGLLAIASGLFLSLILRVCSSIFDETGILFGFLVGVISLIVGINVVEISDFDTYIVSFDYGSPGSGIDHDSLVDQGYFALCSDDCLELYKQYNLELYNIEITLEVKNRLLFSKAIVDRLNQICYKKIVVNDEKFSGGLNCNFDPYSMSRLSRLQYVDLEEIAKKIIQNKLFFMSECGDISLMERHSMIAEALSMIGLRVVEVSEI